MAFGGLKGTLQNAANSITNPFAVTGSVAVVQGDLAFAVFAEQTSLTVGTVTDNLGHTYTAISAGTTSGTATCRAYYTRIVTAGTLTSISATATASTDNVAGVGAVIEGPFRAPPIDKNIAQITTDVTSPFTAPATGTLTQAEEVIIAWGTANYGTVWAATSPNLLAVDQASQSVAKAALGYQAVNSTSTVSPEFTAAGNPSNAILGTASFMRDYPPFTKQALQPLPPYAAARSVILLSAAPTENLALFGPVGIPPPGRITSFDLPPPAAKGSVSLLTRQDTISLALTYVQPSLLPAYWWSAPEGPRRSISLYSWTVQPLPTLTPTPPPPPFAPNWPNPRGASPASWLLGWQNEIIGPVPDHPGDPLPPHQWDWPLPIRHSPLEWPQGWYNNVIGPVPPYAGTKPFAQNDWPVPHRNDWPLELLTELNGVIDVIRPFAKTDWPNPLIVRARTSDLTFIGTFSRATPAPPFHQTDWPLPIPPRRKPALYDFYQSEINVHPPTGAPFFQSDWPVPKGPVHPDVSFAGNAFLPVAAPAPLKPINQQDWPLPKGARFPIEMFGINSGFLPIEPPTPPVDDEFHFRPFIATMGKMTSM